jgi:hypothetical protein
MVNKRGLQFSYWTNSAQGIDAATAPWSNWKTIVVQESFSPTLRSALHRLGVPFRKGSILATVVQEDLRMKGHVTLVGKSKANLKVVSPSRRPEGTHSDKHHGI